MSEQNVNLLQQVADWRQMALQQAMADNADPQRANEKLAEAKRYGVIMDALAQQARVPDGYVRVSGIIPSAAIWRPTTVECSDVAAAPAPDHSGAAAEKVADHFRDATKMMPDHSEDVRGMVASIIDLIDDDAHAATFQTISQYRCSLADSLIAVLERQK